MAWDALSLSELEDLMGSSISCAPLSPRVKGRRVRGTGMGLRPRGNGRLFLVRAAFSLLCCFPVARAWKGLSHRGKAPVETGKGRTGKAGPRALQLA